METRWLAVICLTVFLPTHVQSQECPTGWVSSSASSSYCYQFNTIEIKKSWTEARVACQAHQGELVSYTSTAEKSEVIKTMKLLYNDNNKNYHFWIGLNYLNRSWAWSDGIKYNKTIVNWGPNEPNNHNNEDCGEVDASSNPPTFNDNNCNTALPYVCKRSKTVPIKCIKGWQNIDGQCYLYKDTPLSWPTARDYCSQNGGQLFVVKSDSQESLAFDWAKIKGSSIWIGLKSTGSGNTWAWVNNDTLANKTYWTTSKPVIQKGQENYTCVEVLSTSSSNSRAWSPQGCDARRNFVCQRDEGICSPGWQYDITSQMCYQANANKLLPWDDAKDYCESQGASLVVINSADVANFMKSTISPNFKKAGIQLYWMGLSDSQDDGQLLWVNGNDTSSYTQWLSGKEPPTTPGSLDCAIIWADSSLPLWSLSNSCLNVSQAFVCQVKPGIVVKPAILPSAGQPCKTGYILQRGRCYLFSTDKKTYLQARQFCQKSANGGDLVVIKDFLTQAFINSQLTTSAWIGLHDRKKEGDYVWNSDTSTTNYTNWDVGQPNNRGNAQGENCIVTRVSKNSVIGKWNDLSCSLNVTTFICEAPANPGTVLPIIIGPSWDPVCGPFWEKDPLTNNCYQFNKDFVTWFDAQSTCQHAGGELASIVTLQEQYYFSGRIRKFSGTALWIGANDHNTEGGWQWSDGSPFAYINWDAGEPNNVGSNEDCTTIVVTSAKWNDDYCQRRFPYICKKQGRMTTPTSLPATTLPTGTKYGCRAGWTHDNINNRCYRVIVGNIKWLDARNSCRRQGADLASISDRTENDFVQLLIKQAKKPYGWIGFNDRRLQMSFEWSDGSKVTFTKWAKSEPNNFGGHNEDCVNLVAANGAWNDYTCDKNNPAYVCETSARPTSGVVPTIKGCTQDAQGVYNGFCYGLVTQLQTWSSAQKYCQQKGGNLAHVRDRFVQAYLTNMVGNSRLDYWIGLTKPASHPMAAYIWVSGYKVTYTNWDHDHTAVTTQPVAPCVDRHSNKQHCRYWAGRGECQINPLWMIPNCRRSCNKCGHGKDVGCIVVNGVGSRTGLWSHKVCNTPTAFVCEYLQAGATQPPLPTLPPGGLPCPKNWVESSGYCYKAWYQYGSKKRSWVAARDYCRMLGGDLASYHNASDEAAVMKAQVRSYYRGIFWIGLNKYDNSRTHTWSDSSANDYSNWDDNQPDNHNNQEYCVGVLPKSKKWDDLNCHRAGSWICKIMKGITLGTTPVPPTYAPVAVCDTAGEWTYYNDNCYRMPNRQRPGISILSLISKYLLRGRRFLKRYKIPQLLDWYKARRYCMQYGADLVSIHDQDENDFILRLLGYQYRPKMWIGLNELDLTSYKWSDGSVMNYRNWAVNEPNDYNGGEKCVDYYTDSGLWNDDNCGDLLPFICKRPNSTAPVTMTVPTAKISGKCPSGFRGYDGMNRCYKVIGDDPTDRKNWTDARDACQSMGKGYNLASITSEMEQDFVTIYLRGKSYDLWIGFNDVVYNRQFRWVDNSEVKYTNWGKGQPDGSWNHANQADTDCVVVQTNSFAAGKWNDRQCDQELGYICQTAPDPAIATVEPRTSLVTCKTGYQSFGYNCYKIDTTPRTWADSVAFCKADGATSLSNVASISDNYEQSLTHLIIKFKANGSAAWLGLSYSQKSNVYKWSDGWPVRYTKWDKNEPSHDAGDGCVAMDTNGYWNDTSCDLMLPVICKISHSAPPPTTPVPKGVCPSKDWLSYSDNCYLIPTKRTKKWADASFDCMRNGAALASIHSKDENDFLFHKIQHLSGVTGNLWIGLVKGLNVGFTWEDNTPMGYTNWGTGEPQYKDTRGYGTCTEFYSTNGKWNDNGCISYRYYICKTKKVIPSTLPTQPTLPVTTPGTTKQQTTVPQVKTTPTTYPPEPHVAHKQIDEDEDEDEEEVEDNIKIVGAVGGSLASIVIIATIVVVVVCRRRNISSSEPVQYNKHVDEVIISNHGDLSSTNGGIHLDNAIYHSNNESKTGLPYKTTRESFSAAFNAGIDGSGFANPLSSDA